MTAVDLDQLDSGAQYEVQVMAIVQNREGNPVTVRITTRESHFSYVMFICFLEGSCKFEWKMNAINES